MTLSTIFRGGSSIAGVSMDCHVSKQVLESIWFVLWLWKKVVVGCELWKKSIVGYEL